MRHRHSPCGHCIRLTVAVAMVLLAACSPKTIDDFFGIAMDPTQSEDFQIVSYSPAEGARYTSNADMNPLVYAYAALRPHSVQIKIVNMDTAAIPLHFTRDEYVLHTVAPATFRLLKGGAEDYDARGAIGYRESVDLTLEMPQDFWESVGMRNPQTHNATYTESFWKGESRRNFAREEIAYLEIILGDGPTLVLKPTP